MALDDRNVLDISEAELMETLQLIVASHRKSISAAGDMQVDAGAVSDVPSLPAFLALCIRYPTSPPALRLAIRDHLRDVDDTMVVLRVLEAWIKECTQRDAKLLPRKGDVATATEDLPPLKNAGVLLYRLQIMLTPPLTAPRVPSNTPRRLFHHPPPAPTLTQALPRPRLPPRARDRVHRRNRAAPRATRALHACAHPVNQGRSGGQ